MTSAAANLYVRAIVTPPSHKIAVYNLGATFSCNVHGQGLTSISWIDEATADIVQTITPSFTDYMNTLELRNITENAIYKCQAVFSSPADIIVSDSVNVTVYNILTQPGNVTVVEGQTATFTCEAPDSPVFTWYYDDQTEITSGVDNTQAGLSVLELSALSADRSVFCKALYVPVTDTTAGGTLTSITATVTVNTILIHPTNQTVVIGYNKTLACAGRNSPSISWLKGITSLTTGESLTLTDVTRASQYQCQMSWSEGSLISDKAYVKVVRTSHQKEATKNTSKLYSKTVQSTF